MTDETIEWGGWSLAANNLLAPRRARLFPSEARIVRELIEERKRAGRVGQSTKIPQSGFLSASELARSTGLANVNTLASRVSRLRDVIGAHAIETSRDRGYRIARADKSPIANHPIDDLITNLSGALRAAKRLQLTLKEGLHE